MSGPAGALYVGEVVHKRVRPRRHALRYRVFSLLVDLDRLESLHQDLRLFSLNGFNLFSLHERDFGPRDGSSLADFLRRRAASAGWSGPVARIRMLAYPRILGYAFNPLTVYFLEDGTGAVGMLVYEVRNTFGEHHFYDAPVQGGEILTHELPKAFFVSPFNTLEGHYRFSVRPPGEEVFAGIALSTAEGPVLTAYFRGKRRPLKDLTLAQLALAYPLMTGKVWLGIHWEALLLWVKGVPTTLHARHEMHRRGPAHR